ncbi:MAG: nucleotidyltransferase family protein [Chloroflexi bacterium]|nr:nucleotidyltransferase family protein [Chloroflexota bacterium]
MSPATTSPSVSSTKQRTSRSRYDLVNENHEAILQAAARYGAYNVRVFGSVARGDATPDSDVDFLVDLQPGRSLLDLGGLLMELQDILACEIDIVTEQSLRERVRQTILDEAIPL